MLDCKQDLGFIEDTLEELEGNDVKYYLSKLLKKV